MAEVVVVGGGGERRVGENANELLTIPAPLLTSHCKSGVSPLFLHTATIKTGGVEDWE